MKTNSKIAIMACQACNGMSSQLLPQVQLHFGDNVYILPVSCPGNIKPLSYVSLLRQGWGGLLVICPKESCCCPQKVKSVTRKEVLKGILPIFGIDKDKLEIITATPFQFEKVQNVITNMLRLADQLRDFEKYDSEDGDEYKKLRTGYLH